MLPLIALGAALRRRGHAVDLAAPVPFAAAVERAGLAFQALGTQADLDRHAAHPDLWHPRRGVRAGLPFYVALIEPTYRWLARVARPGESAVVASTLAFGARVAQDKLGLPLATVHVMPVMVESRHAPPVLPGVPLAGLLPRSAMHWIGRGADAAVIDPAVLPGLNALRSRLDLPPARRLRHWLNSPDRVVLMFPDWYAAPQPDWPPQAVQVGFLAADRYGDRVDLPARLAEFVAAGEPPLAFTFGSGVRRPRTFFDAAVRACAAAGRRGVLLVRDGQAPADLPPTIARAPYVPLSRLLPGCAALVHHGGVGTVAAALAAGVPQLVVPTAIDHFDEARRVARLGVGASLAPARLTGTRVARALDRLLADPAVAAACAEARRRMAGGDGTAAACDAVEALMDQGAPARAGSGGGKDPAPVDLPRGLSRRVSPGAAAPGAAPPATEAPPCPITGAPAVRCIDRVDATFLTLLWYVFDGVDVGSLLAPARTIRLWESSAGLTFFDPPIDGDGAFRRALRSRTDLRGRRTMPLVERPDFRCASAQIGSLLPGAARVLGVGWGCGAFGGHLPGTAYAGLDPEAPARAPIGATLEEALEAHAARLGPVYDAACAFDAIAGVRDPLAFARALAACVRPGGLVLIEAPLRSAPETTIPNLALKGPPRRLTWWTPKALGALAAEIGCVPEAVHPLGMDRRDATAYWMAWTSPIRCRDRHFDPDWRWIASLALARALGSRLDRWLPLPKDMPANALLLSARKPG